jgi:pimeloyl-ACP methyl ester carboxylesterase/acyl carrier protein
MNIDKLNLLKDIRSGRLRVDEALARLEGSRRETPPQPLPREGLGREESREQRGAGDPRRAPPPAVAPENEPAPAAGPSAPRPATVGSAPPASGGSATLPLGERFLGDLMRDITDLLKMRPGEIDADTPLMSLGVDSISATEFIGRFAKQYGFKLPPTVLFEFRDVRGFAEHVLEHHRDKLVARYGAAAPPVNVGSAAVPVVVAPPRAVAARREGPRGIEEIWSEIDARLDAPAPSRREERPAMELDALLVSPAGAPPIEVMLHGAGTPMVLLGGLGTQADLWKYQLEALGARHKLILVNLPGCGRSGVDPAGLTLDGIARGVCKVLDTLNIDRPVPVLGYSFGGLVAELLCLDHPGRVSSLVLACTTPRVDRRSLDVPALLREVVQNRDTAEIYRRFDMDLAPVYERCSAGFDVVARLGEISVPTLVLAGARDAYMSPELSREIHRHVRGADIEEVEGAGHLLVLTHADAFNRRVLRFLAERGAARPLP